MLLHHSRRDARVDAGGELVLLEDQDRSLWHRDEIDEGMALRRAGAAARPARTRCRPRSPPSTLAPARTNRLGAGRRALRAAGGGAASPVVELNRAVAVAMAEGPERGLALIDELEAAGELEDYHLLHAARAPTCCAAWARRGGGRRRTGARSSCAANPVERAFLERRLAELG